MSNLQTAWGSKERKSVESWIRAVATAQEQGVSLSIVRATGKFDEEGEPIYEDVDVGDIERRIPGEYAAIADDGKVISSCVVRADGSRVKNGRRRAAESDPFVPSIRTVEETTLTSMRKMVESAAAAATDLNSSQNATINNQRSYIDELQRKVGALQDQILALSIDKSRLELQLASLENSENGSDELMKTIMEFAPLAMKGLELLSDRNQQKQVASHLSRVLQKLPPADRKRIAPLVNESLILVAEDESPPPSPDPH